MMNSCNFTGRLVEDPKFFSGDPDRCCFTLAVDRDINKDAKNVKEKHGE